MAMVITNKDKETVVSNPGSSFLKQHLIWGAKTIRRMTRRKRLERCETELGNCEVTPQALWPVVKSLMKRGEPKAPTAIHGPLGITYHPNENANAIADCLENRMETMGERVRLESKLCSHL
jgi:hypothetical protein